MNILIGYDGSDLARAAIESLGRAGLPDTVSATIVSVSEPSDNDVNNLSASENAAEAATSIAALFPRWKVEKVVRSGAPAAEILSAAEASATDLLVIGEISPGGGERGFFLGQNTQRLLSESECTVRVARRNARSADGPPRLIVGFDGSRPSLNAVESILKRSWPVGTRVRLLAVADSVVLQTLGRFTPQITDAVVEEKLVQQWADSLAAPLLKRFRAAGLEPEVTVRFGNPKVMLPEEARTWNADAIFVGPHSSPNSFARFLIGSVSSAVAARAACSVEIVRLPTGIAS